MSLNNSSNYSINITGLTTGTLNATNITSGLLSATNIVGNSISAGTLSSTTITGANLSLSGLSSLQNVIGTNFSASTLIATTSVTSGLLSATNIIGNSISAGTLSATTITGANLSLSGNLTLAGTLTTVNITSTNMLNTNISAGTINATGLTSLQNVTLTNVSASTLNTSTGITAASLRVTNANVTTSTIATLRVSSNLLALGTSNTIGNIFTNNGNVGVGTVSPGSALHVAGSIPYSPVGAGVHMGIDANGWAGMQFNSTMGGYLDFGVSGGDFTSRILVNAAGNVGINSGTSPAATLDVNGTGKFSGSCIIGGNVGFKVFIVTGTHAATQGAAVYVPLPVGCNITNITMTYGVTLNNTDVVPFNGLDATWTVGYYISTANNSIFVATNGSSTPNKTFKITIVTL